MPAASPATLPATKIAFPYVNWQAVLQAGFPSKYRTDDPQQIMAFVGWANAHGGIAGHKIDPVLLKVDNLDVNAQHAACLQFTQQDKAFMVMDVTALTDPGAESCVTQAHKTPMTSIYAYYNSNYHAEFPYLMSPEGTSDENAANLIAGGKADGFFKISGKLGILRTGCDPASVWNGPKGYYAQLAAAGVPQSNISTYTTQCNNTGVSTEAPAAVLQMKEASVTHILGMSGNLEIPVTSIAVKQGYHPQWLIGDYESVMQNYALLNPGAIDGAYGVSAVVQDYSKDPGAKLCDAVLTGAGLPGLRTPGQDLVAGYLCETMVDAVQIGKLVKGSLTAQSYTSAAQTAGNLFSAQTEGITYGKGDLLGNDKVALVRFSKGCGCWSGTQVIEAPANTQS
jgi:hypothetical protein